MYRYPARFKSQALSQASLRPGPFCWRAAAAWSPRRTSTQWLSSALLSVGKRRRKAWCTRWSRPLQHDQIRQTRICSPCPLPVVPSTMFSFIPCGNHLHFANLLWISMVYDCHKHTSQWTSLLCCYPVATLSRWNEWSISWNEWSILSTLLESWNLGRYYLLDPKPGLADVALNSCRALCGTVSSRPVIQVKTQVKMVYKKLRINWTNDNYL